MMSHASWRQGSCSSKKKSESELANTRAPGVFFAHFSGARNVAGAVLVTTEKSLPIRFSTRVRAKHLAQPLLTEWHPTAVFHVCVHHEIALFSAITHLLRRTHGGTRSRE